MPKWITKSRRFLYFTLFQYVAIKVFFFVTGLLNSFNHVYESSRNYVHLTSTPIICVHRRWKIQLWSWRNCTSRFAINLREQLLGNVISTPETGIQGLFTVHRRHQVCMLILCHQWRRNTPSKQSFGGASHWSQTMPAPPPPPPKKKIGSAERSGATVYHYCLLNLNKFKQMYIISPIPQAWKGEIAPHGCPDG